MSKSALDLWTREHPSVELPRSCVKLASLVGVSRQAIYSTLAHRRRRVKQWIEDLPRLNRRPITLRDAEGERILATSFESWSWDYDPYLDTVTLQVLCYSGSRHDFAIVDRKAFLEKLLEAPEVGRA